MGESRTVVTDVWTTYTEVIFRFEVSYCSSFSTTVLLRIACVAGFSRPPSPFNACHVGYIQDFTLPGLSLPPTYDMVQTIYNKCHLTTTCVHCPCFGLLTVSFNSSFSAKSTQSCSDQKFLLIEHMENLIMDLMLINPYHMVQRMCQL